MKFSIKSTSKFEKDLKRVNKRGYNLELLKAVVSLLQRGEELPAECKDHPLKGDYLGCRECHVTPDWLLVYKQVEDMLVLVLSRTGTHSDLF
ncbi:type II toxin-antitoxin system YafQ family toxin [Eubacteriaceae bacterium ES2]|nr:type II toxin-antitoxin system YafQ family toxin [Eubacteriaceae bacterium ES2]